MIGDVAKNNSQVVIPAKAGIQKSIVIQKNTS